MLVAAFEAFPSIPIARRAPALGSKGASMPEDQA
jgi:hypothetical protein